MPQHQLPREPSRSAVLISIRSSFVEAIFAGRKTVELRRHAPNVAEGTPMVMYSSGRDRAIRGHAVIGQILSSDPDSLWELVGDETGLSRPEYDAYFAGAERAYAIPLEGISEGKRQVSLADMRAQHGLEPPQSWRYLGMESFERIRKAVSAA
jgi:predicted transcriptional regulator